MPTDTAIRVNVRVIHRRLGRGKIVRLYGDHREVAVLFDGDRSATRVQVCDLVPMPAGMPKGVDAGAKVPA